MTIGILGGGQLGRMLVLAGYPLGFRFRLLDPSADAPAGDVAECVYGRYEDRKLLDQCFAAAEVVTYDTENVPVDAARYLASRVPVHPRPEALEVTQDRLHEKRMFQQLGIPTPRFAAVDTWEDLEAAVARIGLPCVLKTRRFGYDGKGQVVIRQPQDAAEAWRLIGGVPLVLEEFVRWERELSLVAVRGRNGEVAYYPLVENHHEAGILRLTTAPAPDWTADLQQLAEAHVSRVLRHLEYVGVLAVEFFQRDDALLANETAPRVHNSGHWTLEGAETSQFENHLRAIAGLPLGFTAALGHSAMINLIGSLPRRADVLAVPGARLHVYGKAPRAGRKVGHVTLHHADPAIVAARLSELRSRLAGPAGGAPDPDPHGVRVTSPGVRVPCPG